MPSDTTRQSKRVAARGMPDSANHARLEQRASSTTSNGGSTEDRATKSADLRDEDMHGLDLLASAAPARLQRVPEDEDDEDNAQAKKALLIQCSNCSRKVDGTSLGFDGAMVSKIRSLKQWECPQCALDTQIRQQTTSKRPAARRRSRKNGPSSSQDAAMFVDEAASALLSMSHGSKKGNSEDAEPRSKRAARDHARKAAAQLPAEVAAPSNGEGDEPNSTQCFNGLLVGQQVVICRCANASRSDITLRRAELEGCHGRVVNIPNYPCTWIGVRLSTTGETIKVRSSNFRIVTGDAAASVPVQTDRMRKSLLFNNLGPGQRVLVTYHSKYKPRSDWPIHATITNQTPSFPCTWLTVKVDEDGAILKVRTSQIARSLDEAQQVMLAGKGTRKASSQGSTQDSKATTLPDRSVTTNTTTSVPKAATSQSVQPAANAPTMADSAIAPKTGTIGVAPQIVHPVPLGSYQSPAAYLNAARDLNSKELGSERAGAPEQPISLRVPTARNIMSTEDVGSPAFSGPEPVVAAPATSVQPPAVPTSAEDTVRLSKALLLPH